MRQVRIFCLTAQKPRYMYIRVHWLYGTLYVSEKLQASPSVRHEPESAPNIAHIRLLDMMEVLCRFESPRMIPNTFPSLAQGGSEAQHAGASPASVPMSLSSSMSMSLSMSMFMFIFMFTDIFYMFTYSCSCTCTSTVHK